MTRTRTNPHHKAAFSFGCTARCSCGWSGATWYGKGAKANAAGEWHHHRQACEKQSNDVARHSGVRPLHTV